MAVNVVECDFDLLGRNFILQNWLLKRTGFPSFNYALFTELYLWTIFQVIRGSWDTSIRKLMLSSLTVPTAAAFTRAFWEQGIFNLLRLSGILFP